MVLQADTALSSDRIAGHVSDLAGERAIMDRCHRLMQEEQAPILRDICGGYSRPTIPQILEAQARGETSVQQVLTTAFEYLAIATANVCNLVRPDMIFVDSRLFHTHQNQEILTQTIRKFLVASHNTEPAFEFIVSDVHNGARCAALCAIRHELDQYEEGSSGKLKRTSVPGFDLRAPVYLYSIHTLTGILEEYFILNRMAEHHAHSILGIHLFL